MSDPPSDPESEAADAVRGAGPGAALVLLRRLASRTDVFLPEPGSAAPALPWAAPRHDVSQGGLVEELIQDSGIGAVDRVYGSALTVLGSDGPLGVFVAFVGDPEADAPARGSWTDLRRACRELPADWASALASVRERFVARAPDEALRIR
jgi:hypothetical protein